MSRQPTNAAHNSTSDFRGQMDMLTIIDPSCLKIPYKSNKINSNVRQSKTSSIHLLSSPEEPNIPEKASGEVKIEIKRVVESQKTCPEEPYVTSISGWLIPLGYILFAAPLALCNLFLKSSVSGSVCILFSPIAMLSLAAHALTLQSSLVGRVGLLGSAWILPFACSAWSLTVTLWYLSIVGISLAMALCKVPALVLSAFLFVCLVSSTPSMVVYHGIDSQWGVFVSAFLVVVLAVSSSLHLTRVTFKIRPVL